jgi:hypothetical protein
VGNESGANLSRKSPSRGVSVVLENSFFFASHPILMYNYGYCKIRYGYSTTMNSAVFFFH